MIRPFALTIAILALSAGAAGADAARPSLRAEAVVTGNVVRIGDLIENAGIVANAPIFRAPALGQTGVVSAAQVLDAVRGHALVGIDPGDISEIRVIRASRAIASHEIEVRLAASLAKTYNLGAVSDIAIAFDRTLRTVQVEPNITDPGRVEQVRYDSHSGRFDAIFEVSGAPSARMRLSGTAFVTSEIVAPSRSLARGEIISASDLAMKRIPRSQVSADTVTDPEQAIGRAAREPISAGRPMRISELMKPQLVQRNETVTLVYQVPGIMLAVRGKAVDGGAEGDVVDVVNVQSNRTVRGTITGPGRVSVSSMAARVIASAEAVTNEIPARVNEKRK
jgi:flagella basal body P-ring formation protein FlgA